MPDTQQNPIRLDANGNLVDNHFTFLNGPQGPVPFNGVAGGGETTYTSPIAQVTGVTPTAQTGAISVAFSTVTNADRYQLVYWDNKTPNTKLSAWGTASPIIAPNLTSGHSYTVQILAEVDYGRGEFCQGPLSGTGSATAL
jgi:hypothetical protein